MAETGELERLMGLLGITRRELAALTDTHINTVHGWVSGKRRVPKVVLAYLELRLKVKKLVEV